MTKKPTAETNIVGSKLGLSKPGAVTGQPFTLPNQLPFTSQPTSPFTPQPRNNAAKGGTMSTTPMANRPVAIQTQSPLSLPLSVYKTENRARPIVQQPVSQSQNRRVSLPGIGKLEAEKKSATTKYQIFGGSEYSKVLLRGVGDANDLIHSNSNLKFLDGTNQLFFRKCKAFPPEISLFNPKEKRGIWNESGRVVFYTGLRKSSICQRCYYSGFIQEVVDYTGQTVIVSKGHQFWFGLTSVVEVSAEDGQVLGTMHQTCLSSTYEIKDTSGRTVYKIQAPCFAPCAPFVFWCCKEHFEICMDDGVTEIGKITKFWGNDVAAVEFKSCLGIEMDRVDDVRVKALMMGCFFLIEFQYYRLGGNGPIYFILILCVLAGIVALSECAGYCPFWRVMAYDNDDPI